MTSRCPTCKELRVFDWPKLHKCKPKWWCWHDDGENGYYETDDGGTAVYAQDAQEAAVKYCDDYPEHDMSEHETIVVKRGDGDEWVKVDVSAEWTWFADYGDPEPFVPPPIVTCKYCLSDMRADRRETGVLEFPEHNNKGGGRCPMSTARIMEDES